MSLNAFLLWNPLSLPSHIFVLLISATEPRSLWLLISVHILTQLELFFFAAGETGEQLGGESPPAPKPQFSESAGRGAAPSTTGTVPHLLGWREGWGWLWFRSVWCRALLLAAAPSHHELWDEEMLWRVTELARDALANIMTLEGRLWCKRDMAYLRQSEGTRDKTALRGPWKIFVQ